MIGVTVMIGITEGVDGGAGIGMGDMTAMTVEGDGMGVLGQAGVPVGRGVRSAERGLNSGTERGRRGNDEILKLLSTSRADLGIFLLMDPWVVWMDGRWNI